MVTKLTPEPKDLIWGSVETEPWYPNPEKKRVAEVWFPSGELLIKFLFTTENLSVQVHPNDEQAHAAGKPRGKTEMWHILRAEPGARIALGLKREVAADQLRAAAVDGSIVDLLNWIPVSAGQTFFTPAGTIHAIGAGIALCEIQQMSDITYRLYDWGRGRELHLDAGIAVSRLGPNGEGPVDMPVGCEYFRTNLVTDGDFDLAPGTLVIGLDGSADCDGVRLGAGEVLRGERIRVCVGGSVLTVV